MKSILNLKGNGQFHISDVTNLSYTYFPLCNTKAMKSSIAPSLAGDAKVDQNSFLLLPTSIEDLENTLMKRNVYFRVNDTYTWSTTGQTPSQLIKPDKVDLYGDFLVHKIIRENNDFTCTIESFVPSNDTYQELHKITIKNTRDKPLKLKSVIGIPIYGRSAENIRDHRHVTSLLNRIKIVENGIINHPTFSFDERGHILNQRQYGVFSMSSHHQTVKQFHPVLEEFTGEGNTLLDPLVVKENNQTAYKAGDVVQGFEAIAGIEYEQITLNENEESSIVISLMISDDESMMKKTIAGLDVNTFEQLKEDTKAYWKKALSSLVFHFPNQTLNGWLKWVTLQPILRRIYGNSFMPHHDYGRGGRGWRDLWQDLLALILMKPTTVKEMLINNFKGVRIDGSNATIIGDKPGEFLADRNNIARIWMDHGSWPLLTTKLYLDQSGDTDVLFEEVSYFQDQFTHYTKKIKEKKHSNDTRLKTHQGNTYYGTVLEHLFVQNLVPYYNVGNHNNIRLEDADWNDGLDMANKHGESVAFTSFYGQNLITLSELLTKLYHKGVHHITLYDELSLLLQETDYSDVTGKNTILKAYFDLVADGISGQQTMYDTLTLANTLYEKGFALLNQVRQHEWLEENGEGWFNGYYDNDSCPLDNVKEKHMTLTGQVFSIMSDAATEEQVQKVIFSADKYLYDKTVGGYRLNTDFKEVKTNMGRLFGFAYGHKENGAMFSHMAVMYAYALYKRGFVEAGYKVLNTLYLHSIDLENAKMYPGIPEYFNSKGRGVYAYLTGSASWMILTMVTEVFGVKADLGLPIFEPKLLLEQFDEKTELKIETVVGNEIVEVIYQNPLRLTYGEYEIDNVMIDEKNVDFSRTAFGIKLKNPLSGTQVIISFAALKKD